MEPPLSRVCFLDKREKFRFDQPIERLERNRWRADRPKQGASMRTKREFSKDLLAALQASKGLRIRAGSQHRFIGIWFVLVRDRLFVRSWSVKPNGWYRTFRRQPRGAVQIEGYEVAVRAVSIGDGRLRDTIDQAYLDKYNSPGAVKYAKDLGRAKSRATTLELVLVSSRAARAARGG